MNTIKVEDWRDIPSDFTGIVEYKNGDILYQKNGKNHREDGPTYICKNGYKEWWLDNRFDWSSDWNKLDLRNKIVLSKEQHPEYPTCQVLNYIDEDGIQEQIIIPEMEEYIIE